jgi:colanic acid/amylovoran biosynthesis protein
MESDKEFNAVQYLTDSKAPLNALKVGITVRPYRFDGHPNPKEAYNNYINSFKNFIQYLISKSYHPVLIAQTMGPSFNEDDNEAIKLIVSGFQKEELTVISDKTHNAKMVKKIYSKMDYVVGTRFHSVIFSLSSKVPSIAISYGGNKGKGIMNELNLSKFEIPIDKLNNSELLIRTFNSLVSSKDSYIKQIENKMIEYYEAREVLKAKIAEVINKK